MDHTDIDIEKQSYDEMRLTFDQIAQNNARRILICLCVDASASMSKNQRIETVNREIDRFLKKIDGSAQDRDGLEVCLVAFGDGAEVKCEFGPLAKAIESDRSIEPTGSRSELGAGVTTALERLDARMKVLSSANGSYYVPWLILISDGEATDAGLCEQASEEVRRRSNAGRLKVKCLTLGDGDDGVATLQKFTLDGQVDKMDALQMVDFFAMLSRSISSASRQSVQRGDLNII